MKKLLLVFSCLFQISFAVAQNNFGIGTITPDASALLDLSATDKGFLPPRLTTTQKLAVPNPATGLLVFDITTNSFWYFNGIIWVEALCQQNTTGFIHYVGELYGGGIVVSVWKEGGTEHGLIASLTDLSNGIEWSNVTSIFIGTSAQNSIDGQANTNAIIFQPGHTSSGALLCDGYSGGGFNDWYLPALWELRDCFKSSFIVNNILGSLNGFKDDWYWSSNESTSNNNRAWQLSFAWFAVNENDKSEALRVRAVRRY